MNRSPFGVSSVSPPSRASCPRLRRRPGAARRRSQSSAADRPACRRRTTWPGSDTA
jgi:hypothetical protein